MFMRLVFGAFLFGLGYYVGREVERSSINDALIEGDDEQSVRPETSGDDAPGEGSESDVGVDPKRP